MATVRPNRLVRGLVPGSLWRMPEKEKRIYLTFDDGPVPGITEAVLDCLENSGVPATFFCVGANVEKHPAIFSRLLAEGHAAGNHTYDHRDGWKSKTARYLESVEKCELAFEKVNRKPGSRRLFRPPYGRVTPIQARKLKSKYTLVMWDVLTGDYDQRITPEKCLERSIRAIRPGSIVVFHDSKKAEKNMLYTLPRFIEHCLQSGYSFGKLDG